MKTWVRDARDKAGLTPEDCASTLHCSRTTYLSRENAPGTLTLTEVSVLMSLYDDNSESRDIIRRAVSDVVSA